MKRLPILALALVGCALTACQSAGPGSCGAIPPPPQAIITMPWIGFRGQPMTEEVSPNIVTYEKRVWSPSLQSIQAPNACAPAIVNPCGPVGAPPESVPAYRAPTK